MAYHTPQLLLVGAAQNLVLGVDKLSLGKRGNEDFPSDNGYNTFPGVLDSNSW